MSHSFCPSLTSSAISKQPASPLFSRSLLSPLVISLFIGLLGSCAKDSLGSREPILSLEAFTNANVTAENPDATGKEPVLTIDLGEVPLYSIHYAKFYATNPTSVPLFISSMTYDDEFTVGGDWIAPQWLENINDRSPESLNPDWENIDSPTPDETWQITISDFGDDAPVLQIGYSPVNEGAGEALVRIRSNAVGRPDVYVKVLATGVFRGAPDIEVEYNGIVGPNASDCADIDADGVADACVLAQPLNLGGVALGGRATGVLKVRNAATCEAAANAEPCSTCVLSLRPNPNSQNIGLGFKEGTNVDGYFSFQGSTATPVEIPQADGTCTVSNSLQLPIIKFDAPDTEGTYSTVVVIESNSPGEPLIEIPIIADARNAPIAIADFNLSTSSNPSPPYTIPTELDPLTRVYFDGRPSYDPIDPTDGSRITDYLWEVVEAPNGADPGLFSIQGQGTPLASMFIPIAGDYVMRLTVKNSAQIASLDTPESRVEFTSVPSELLHVQLVWDNVSNDQDLHMTFATQDDRVCNGTWDTHFLNKKPSWFPSFPVATGPNPSLDRDDTNGLGPENISIKEPEPGTYRIYVHYYGDRNVSGTTPTRETIRIYLNGLQMGEFQRVLTTEKSVWAVADITWYPDGSGTVTPYASDIAGQIGAVQNMQDCSSPGFSFP